LINQSPRSISVTALYEILKVSENKLHEKRNTFFCLPFRSPFPHALKAGDWDETVYRMWKNAGNEWDPGNKAGGRVRRKKREKKKGQKKRTKKKGQKKGTRHFTDFYQWRMACSAEAYLQKNRNNRKDNKKKKKKKNLKQRCGGIKRSKKGKKTITAP
jgi:hypothetical protein